MLGNCLVTARKVKGLWLGIGTGEDIGELDHARPEGPYMKADEGTLHDFKAYAFISVVRDKSRLLNAWY